MSLADSHPKPLLPAFLVPVEVRPATAYGDAALVEDCFEQANKAKLKLNVSRSLKEIVLSYKIIARKNIKTKIAATAQARGTRVSLRRPS